MSFQNHEIEFNFTGIIGSIRQTSKLLSRRYGRLHVRTIDIEAQVYVQSDKGAIYCSLLYQQPEAQQP